MARPSGSSDTASVKRSRWALRTGLLLGCLVILAQVGGIFGPIEGWLTDRRAHWTTSMSPEPSDLIVHVDIDEGALEAVGRWPWDRTGLAYAIESLADAGASVVLLDILLTHPDEPRWARGPSGALVQIDDDARLARAIREAGNVVLACAIEPRGAEGVGIYGLRTPIPDFLEGARAIGFVNSGLGSEGTFIRALRPEIPVGEQRFVQIGVACGALMLGLHPDEIEVSDTLLRLGDRAFALRDGRMAVPFRPRSADEVLARQQEAEEGGRPFVRVDGDPLPWHHVHDRVAITPLVQIGRTLDTHRHERHAAMTLLNGAEPSDPPTIDELANADDNAAFFLEDAPATLNGALAASAPDEAALVRAAFAWRTLRRPEGDPRVQEALQMLEVLRERVEGKLAIVGWTADGAIADFYPTTLGGRTPGSSVHGAIANGLLTGHWLARVPAWFDLTIGALAVIIATLIAQRLPPGRAALLLVLALVIFCVLNIYLLYGHLDQIAALGAPIVAAVLSWSGASVVRAIDERRARERLTKQFRARVSSSLVDYLANHPETINMAGEEREITTCFIDIVGFTSLSESLTGAETVRVLNRCLGTLTEAQLSEQAYVNKFLGDGVMSFYGAPVEDPDQADHAIRAIVRCLEALVGLNEIHAREGLPALGLRAGISTGRVVVGDCGAPPMLNDYTVIGDAVNLAARLESAGKLLGADVLVSRSTYDLLSEPVRAMTLWRPLGTIRVVGQRAPVEIFEVLASGSDASAAQRVERWSRATRHFIDGELRAARDLFEELTAHTPSEPGARLYLEACDAVLRDGREHEPVLTLRSK